MAVPKSHGVMADGGGGARGKRVEVDFIISTIIVRNGTHDIGWVRHSNTEIAGEGSRDSRPIQCRKAKADTPPRGAAGLALHTSVRDTGQLHDSVFSGWPATGPD